jgi:serine/threonine-protein kinase RsbW
LRTSEDFDAVRIGLGKFTRSLETSNTQYDFGEIELVLAEVLNNIAEHGGRESINHPISPKWHTSDGLCINVIDAGQCIPTGTITNAQMPNLDTEIDHLPEGGFGWALVGILCSKVHAKRRGSFNTLRLYFPKITLPQRILISHSNSSHR